jgi:glyoxylase-like metal-dependent hydrolase (beta-lactamase superfamily II)
MVRQILCALVLTVSLSAANADSSSPFHFEFEEIARGVWVGIRPESVRPPVMGNTTFIISDEGVVVFDGGGMPAMADQVIEKIRSLTDTPVTHVVISHWHGDHNFGNHRFVEAFPDVEIVAHEFTRDVFNSTRINYIDGQRNFKETILPQLQSMVEQRARPDGTAINDAQVARYQRLIDDADVFEAEARRARVTPPTVVFTDSYTIESGARRIELQFLGHGNTEGDIVMWLPEERIVATGDIVVVPSPYAFNMPPRPWAEVLRRIKELDYDVLVPGHGAVQTDTAYVDLLIATADNIADQAEQLIASGTPEDDIAAALDFSDIEEKFTGGDEQIRIAYEAWFEGPFRAAAVKALGDGPMVTLEPPTSVPFDDAAWKIEAAEHELVEHLGKPALRIKGGAAVLPEVDLANAIVEFEIAVSKQRGFAGLVFRMQDEGNFEHFYIRPHQSGNPDANQYTPVFNGVSAWQLYHGADFAAPVEYSFDQWMNVKVVFAGSKAEVFIDSDEPVLRINDLRRDDLRGTLGLNSANFSAVHFANFRYTQLSEVYEFSWVGEEQSEAAGTVGMWEVSDAFDGRTLAGVTQLDPADLSARNWSKVEAEASGITNLAMANGLAEGQNTVFARMSVNAETADTKQLLLGYSDAAVVFVNGQRVYGGDNTYMSRDYRYLGTIGLFDSVPLALKKGENEICVAVTEAFGGWGIMGRVVDFGESP